MTITKLAGRSRALRTVGVRLGVLIALCGLFITSARWLNPGRAAASSRGLTAPAAPTAAISGHIYALQEVANGANRIHGFTVNETTGALTALPGFPVATGGTGTGINETQKLIVDKTNQRLYAVNDGSDTISAFALDAATGALTPLPFSPINLGAGDWRSLAVHPSGSPLLVGQTNGTAGLLSIAITAQTATLVQPAPFTTGAASPEITTFNSTGGFVYTGGSIVSGTVAGFAVNAATGVLTPLAGSPFNLNAGPLRALVIDNAGDLLTAHDDAAQLLAFTTNATGIPSGVNGNPFASGLTNGIGGGVLHPAGFYLVANQGSDRIGSYRVTNAGSSNLTLTAVAGSPFVVSGSTATNSLALNQSGNLVFAANLATRNLTTFTFNTATGVLAAPSTQAINTLGNTGKITGLAYAPPPPSGHLYVLNRGANLANQVFGFAVDEASGELTALPGFPLSTGNGSNTAFSEQVAVDETNRRLYVVNDGDDTVSAFSINQATGVLTPLPFSPIALPAGTWSTIAVHPAGSPLIVGDADNAPSLASFVITPTTATAAAGSPLNLISVLAPFSSTFNASGTQFFSGGTGSQFAGFSVNAATGALTLLDGLGTFDSGAANPRGLATDSAGHLLLANGSPSQARAFSLPQGTFTPANGNPFAAGLTSVQFGLTHPNGFYLMADAGALVGVMQIAGSDAATSLTSVAGSPFASGGTFTNGLALNQNGKFLYAANSTSRNLTTYSFSECTGVLTALSTQAANTLGASGRLSGIGYLKSTQPVPAPNLNLLKTDNSQNFILGGTGAYELTVSNSGGAGATACPVVITDNLPNGLTLASFSGTGWVCTGAGTATVTCANPQTLNGGASLPVLTLTCNVGAATPLGTNSISNTATVATAGEVLTNNNSASDTTTVVLPPDLTITKTDNNQNFFIGQTGAYIIGVANAPGAGPAIGEVRVTDVLPTGLTLASFSGPGWTCSGTTTVICTHAINNAPIQPVALTVNVGATTPLGTNSITNTATVSFTGEVNTANNSASDTTTVIGPPPNLTLSKAHGNSVFEFGHPAAYSIVVSNAAGAGATTGAITVTDPLPTGLTLAGFSGQGWTCTGTTNLTCTHAGPLAAGPSQLPTLTLTVNVGQNTGETITNTATVSTPGETVTNNNSGSDTTSVAGPPDLTLSKTHGGSIFEIGETASYFITVRNAPGLASTTGAITVTDPLPTGLTLESFSGQGWSCSGTTTVTCTHAGPLAAGPSQLPTLTLSVNVGPNAPATITNIATVSTPGETVTDNNSGSDEANVITPPNLSLTLTDNGASFITGATGTYRVSVSNAANAGPTTEQVGVGVTLPANLTLNNFSGAGWSCRGFTAVNCENAATIAPGASLPLLTLTVNVGVDTPASVTTAAELESDGGFVSASDTTTILPEPAGVGGRLYVLNENGTSSNRIFGFAVNEATGALTPLPGFPINTGGIGASFAAQMLALDAANRRLYAVNTFSGTVSAFAINAATGALTPLPFSPLTVTGDPDSIAVHPSGSPLLVGDAQAHTLRSFAVTATTATAAPGNPFPVSSTQTFPLAFSRNGTRVFAGGGSQLSGFNVNAASGALTALAGFPLNSQVTDANALVTDVGERLFLADGFGGALRVLGQDEGSNFNAGPFASNIASTTPAGGVLHPHGFYLVTGEVGDNVAVHQVVGFSPVPDMPAVAGSPFATGGVTSNALALNRDGTFVFVVNGDSRNLTTFSFNRQTGVLGAPALQAADTLGTDGLAASIAYFPPQAGVVQCPTITVNPAALATGTAGVAFNQTFTQTGGAGNVTFALTGTLPNGLAFSGATLSGTPTQTGSFNLTVTATDANGCTGSSAYTLTINPPACPTITVNPAAVPAGTVGAAYSQAFTQTGGAGNVTFALTGTLPNGLTFSNAALAGTPTQAGTFNVTVTATDANGCTGSRAYTLVINCATITVNPATLPNGTAGTAYSQSLAAAGGNAPHTFAVSAGTLPAGLALATGGVLSGTPTAPGTSNFTVTVTDANGCTGSRAYTLVINCPAITLNPAALPNGTAGTAYSQTLTAAGGATPHTFALAAGSSLPAGLTLSAGGVISGTPTATGTFNFTVNVSDANQCGGSRAYTLVINCPAITVNPATIPAGTTGTAYSQTFTQTGGAGAVTFALSGLLPNGLAFGGATLSGTPTQSGSFNVTVEATDVNGCTGSRNYTLTINNAACPTITINPVTIPAGTMGTAYSQTFTQTGGAGTGTFALSGTLPNGVTFNNATLAGTPTQAGSFPITVTATDANGCTGSRAYTLVVAVVCPAITINPATIPAGVTGTAYSQTFTQTGGTGTVSFSVTGTLPGGLTLSGATLAGTPTQAGVFTFTVTATDANGCTGSRVYVLQITGGCATITVEPSTLPNAAAGVSYNQTLSATPAGTYTFTLLAGSLPPGFALNSATGVLSGVTTGTGTFNFTVRAASNGCTGTRAYTLTVACPAITLSALPDGTTGAGYNQTLTATPAAPAGSSYSFAVTAGALPNGLALNGATGVLSGTPNTVGTSTFTVRATGFGSCQGTRAYTLQVRSGQAKKGDLDGDGKADLAVWTPGNGNWKALNSTNNQTQTIQWGAGFAPFNDVIVPGDYDGDGKADHAIWRGADSIWYIRPSANVNAPILQLWGTSNAPFFDIPTPSDFDGDGKTDLAVFRPATGVWFVKRSSDGGATIVTHGQNGDVPVAADYDGDGKTDFAVFRPSALNAPNWFILQSSTNTVVALSWGAGVAPFNDVPVPADYDGDGKADLAIWRGADSVWFIRPSANPNAPVLQLWGSSNAPFFDIPAPADYDGDGKADIAVWRRDGTWFVLRSSNNTNLILTHGQNGDVPVPAKGVW